MNGWREGGAGKTHLLSCTPQVRPGTSAACGSLRQCFAGGCRCCKCWLPRCRCLLRQAGWWSTCHSTHHYVSSRLALTNLRHCLLNYRRQHQIRRSRRHTGGSSSHVPGHPAARCAARCAAVLRRPLPRLPAVCDGPLAGGWLRLPLGPVAAALLPQPQVGGEGRGVRGGERGARARFGICFSVRCSGRHRCRPCV